MPFASFDPEACSWRTSQLSLLEGSTEFSETWPRAGTMRSGTAYQRQPSAPRTYATEFSLSRIAPTLERPVPTPLSSMGERGGRGELLHYMKCGSPRGPLPPLVPTPNASVANDGEKPDTWLARRERVKAKGINGNGMGMPLSIYAQLLPTPTTNDAKNATAPPSQWDRKSPQIAVQAEILGGHSREARSGGALNPTWVEWLMGFPTAWTACAASETPSSPQ